MEGAAGLHGLTPDGLFQLAAIVISFVVILVRVESATKTNQKDLHDLREAMSSQHTDLKKDMKNDFSDLRKQIGNLFGRASAADSMIARVDSRVVDHERRLDVAEKRIDRMSMNGRSGGSD